MRRFVLDGQEYDYCLGKHNAAHRNERTVEVPIGARLLEQHGGRALEVGNVLSNYMPISHVVIDLSAKKGSLPVLRRDVVDFDDEDGFDLIISISTMEHVGFPLKFNRGMANLKRLLRPSGTMMITMPMGYHKALDDFLVTGEAGFTQYLRMVRVDEENNWEERPWPDKNVFVPYGTFCPGAAADLFIGIYRKAA